MKTIEEMLEKYVAARNLGPIDWVEGKNYGYVKCPHHKTHTKATGPKHTRIFRDNNPQFDCRHDSCGHLLEENNRELREHARSLGLISDEMKIRLA